LAVSWGGGGLPSLDLVDSTTDRLLTEVPLAGAPSAAALDQSAGLLALGGGAGYWLSLINTTTDNVTANVPNAGFGYPVGMAFDSMNGELFVLCDGDSGAGLVVVVNMTTHLAVDRIAVGVSPTNIVDDPSNGELYVANSGSNNVSVINGSNNSLAATIAVGNFPSEMAVDPSNGTVYVLNVNVPINLTVVNTSSNSIHSTIPLPSPWNSTGSLAVDPTTSQLFVALDATTNLTIVSTTNNSFVRNITVGLGPFHIAMDSAVHAAVVLSYGTGVPRLIFLSPGNDSILGNLTVWNFPNAIWIDPATGEVDLPDASTDQIQVVNASSRTFAAQVSVGLSPNRALYDPLSGTLFVTESDAGGVTLVNGSTDSVLGTVATGAGASVIALGTSVDRVFVLNSGAETVTYFNATTNALLTTVGAGSGPSFVAWDPLDGELFVADTGSNEISVLNGTTGALVATISGLVAPARMVMNLADGELYVLSSNGGPVSVINGSSFQFVANVTLPGNASALSIQYDPATAETWAVTSTNALMAISGATNRIVSRINLTAGGTAIGMTVDQADPSNGTVLVSFLENGFAGAVQFVNLTAGTAGHLDGVESYPGWILFDSPENVALVENLGTNDVTVLNLSTQTGVATVVAGSYPTSLALDPVTATAYATDSGWGTLTELGPPAPYPVQFTEVGLPAGTNWSLSLDGTNGTSATPTITLGAPNGTHGYTVPSLQSFVAEPSSGNFTVGGSGLNLTVRFVPTYPVLFTESGLPNGTSWAVAMNRTTNRTIATSILFAEPNGTFGFQVLDVPGWRSNVYAGSLQIAGSGMSVRLNWTPAEYEVNFTASGLAAGKSWAILLNGSTYRSSSATIGVRLLNGTYSYSVAGAPGFAPITATGSVVVAGASFSRPVNFTTGYFLLFQEYGLPDSTPWSATVNGSLNFSSTPTIGFEIPNGTFVYRLQDVPGWRTENYHGYVSIDGWAQTWNVTWNRTTYPVSFAESGLPFGKRWTATVGGIAVSTTSYSELVPEPNGSVSYTVGNVPGWRANAYSGSFNVSGAATTVTVNWTQTTFPVTFTEVGLPPGLLWSIRLNGGALLSSTSSSIQVQVPNGTPPYEVGYLSGWRPSATDGYLWVDGAPSGITIFYHAVTYSIVLTEVGLPAGTPWAVSALGVTNRSVGASISWTAPNGTFSFNVTNLPGWRASVYHGLLPVNSGPDRVTIVWVRSTYLVNVEATGLPEGHGWTATLNGTTLSFPESALAFSGLANGSYPFSVSAPGYVGMAPPKEVVVNGAAVTVQVHFGPPSRTGVVAFGATALAVVIVGFAVAGVAAAWLVFRIRRRPPGRSPTNSSTGGNTARAGTGGGSSSPKRP